MKKCRSCGAPVFWKWTDGGRRMPIDAEPVANGNVVIAGDRARVMSPIEALALGDVKRYTAHFATCPNADEWRRPRK